MVEGHQGFRVTFIRIIHMLNRAMSLVIAIWHQSAHTLPGPTSIKFSYPSPIASLDLIPLFLQKKTFSQFSSSSVLPPHPHPSTLTPTLSVSLLPSQNNIPISTHDLRSLSPSRPSTQDISPSSFDNASYHFKPTLFTMLIIADISFDAPNDHWWNNEFLSLG